MLYLYNASIVTVARMDKFNRGMVLAKSLKSQKEALKLAHKAVKAGALKCAKHYMKLWKKKGKRIKSRCHGKACKNN